MGRSVWPTVSIVFLAYNRRDTLAVALDQVLERLDYPADRLELIVVDNASTDGTAEMVEEHYPAVRVLRSPRNVGASAWNEGMTTARGEWRMILDDDCYISGDALKVAVSRAEEHEADVVSFRVLSSTTPGFSFNDDEYRTGLLSFWGCSAMFSRRAIESEPFYDPYIFIWANEMELTMRLLDRGFRHLYLPEVESVHMKEPSGTGYNDRAVRINMRHWAYIAAKNMRARDAFGAVANLALHLVFHAVGGERRMLRALPDVARGAWAGLRRRAPVCREVSRLYRRHTFDFASPVGQMRSPRERLRRDLSLTEQRMTAQDRWYAARRDLYPDRTATLSISALEDVHRGVVARHAADPAAAPRARAAQDDPLVVGRHAPAVGLVVAPRPRQPAVEDVA